MSKVRHQALMSLPNDPLTICTRVRPNTKWGSYPYDNMLTTHGMGSESHLLPLISPFSGVAMKGAAVNGADIRHPFKVSSAYEKIASAGYK
jgi:hypothetical protein